uniref:Elongation of very long chain fatty acids protein n=1 Tax=Heterorhabditis bacteriophora TaxID=37862 RepID=A0A1I7X097_HETBA
MVYSTIPLVMNLLYDLNKFDIYSGNHTSLNSQYRYKFALPYERVDDPKGWTVNIFQRYWYHSITISVIYFAVIKGIQKSMENKKPFVLKTPLILWNGSLAIFSIMGVMRFSEVDFIYSLVNHGWYNAICYSCHPNDVAAFWSLLFAISKIVELGDTLFIVLRKKPLIFLHYYHHAAVLIYTVHSGAEHTAAGRAFISMNYLAHSCMYSYYAIVAYGIRMPRWIFLMLQLIPIRTTKISLFLLIYRCQQSMANLYLAFTIYITFAVLFFHFFYKTYIAAPKPKKE